jgi:zinc protease
MNIFKWMMIAAGALTLGVAAADSEKPAMLPQRNSSPLVNFRILFMTGAADDPVGKKGIAALTAAMLSQGGSEKLAYEEIMKRMYPMATSLGGQVDKEMTVFVGATHKDNLEKYYELARQMILEPGFREEDFSRLKEDAINYLKVSLRDGNDEELAKEELYNIIYAGHPYGHENVGAIADLEKLTLADVKAWYKEHFTQANLVIGLSGGFTEEFAKKMRADFKKLPEGKWKAPVLASPKLAEGWEAEIVQRETRATAISMGFPISVKRGDPDWPALAAISSYLGQHRSSNSHLYQRLREARGLNYGDYSYIEYFPRGMFQFQPDPNLARQQQIFQIWIRPVPPEQAHFALRAALYEFDKLLKDGISKESFEATREFLTKNAPTLVQTQDEALGYALDSRYYGIPEFTKYFRDGLKKLTLEKVNEVLRRELKPDRMRIVIVAKDGEKLKEALVSNAPSPMKYNSPKPQEVLDEDKVIEKFAIPLKAERVKVVPVEKVFQD